MARFLPFLAFLLVAAGAAIPRPSRAEDLRVGYVNGIFCRDVAALHALEAFYTRAWERDSYKISLTDQLNAFNRRTHAALPPCKRVQQAVEIEKRADFYAPQGSDSYLVLVVYIRIPDPNLPEQKWPRYVGLKAPAPSSEEANVWVMEASGKNIRPRRF
jgi:hypothetical protein